MFVDDEPNILLSLKFLISQECYEVRTAGSGEEALQALSEQVPDLILLDVMMPDVSGLEVCAQLKKNPATQSIPIFMLTGRTQVQDIEEALAAGADNYISKPFDPQKLSRIIEVKMKNL